MSGSGPGALRSSRNIGILLTIIDASKFADRNTNERCAVVTIAVGDRITGLRETVEPTHRYYANRIGADHIVIDQAKICGPKFGCEKFQIYNFFDGYDRILYIDLDAIPRPDCPDLFSLVPPNCLGVRYEKIYNQAAFPLVFFSKSADSISNFRNSPISAQRVTDLT